MAPNSSDEQLGLRERKKKESMARLFAAARQLIWEKGYDAVTTKEIASQADIGEATLFRYVPSKLDLFLLIYSEEFERVIDDCEAQDAKFLLEDSTDPEQYVRRIVESYRMLAELYTKYPELAYTYVKESFGSLGDIGQSGLAHADRWFGLLDSILRQGQKAGVLVDVDPSTVVQNCHALYVHEVLRSHARSLSPSEMPSRLCQRLEVLLLPLQVLPRAQWVERLRRTRRRR